jgi:hypothetical protein
MTVSVKMERNRAEYLHRSVAVTAHAKRRKALYW